MGQRAFHGLALGKNPFGYKPEAEPRNQGSEDIFLGEIHKRKYWKGGGLGDLLREDKRVIINAGRDCNNAKFSFCLIFLSLSSIVSWSGMATTVHFRKNCSINAH